MKTMNTINKTIFTLGVTLSATLFTACSTVSDFDDTSESEARDDDASLPMTAGGLWEPCLFENEPGGLELDGWGCDGEPGSGLACMKPVGDNVKSICVPYSSGGCPADIEYDGEPFGLGYVEGKSYCQPYCDTDGDCLAGMECSSHNLCAWVHE